MKQWMILFLTALSLAVFSSPVQAHGDHFGSVEALASHIDSHVAYLEGLIASGLRDESAVRRQYSELIDHAQQYQRFARTLIRHQEHVRMAKSLEIISGSLAEAARAKDIGKSFSHLKEIQKLVKAEIMPVIPAF